MGDKAELPDKPTEEPSGGKEPEQELIEDGPNGAEAGEAFRKLVEKKPGLLAEFTAMGMTSVGNPLHDKMTPEHISQIIDLSSRHDENQFKLTNQSIANEHSDSIMDRVIGVVVFLVVIALVVFIVLIFREKPEVLIPALTGIGGFIGGFAGGWGFGRKQHN